MGTNDANTLVGYEDDEGEALAIAPDSFLKGRAEWTDGAYCVTASVLAPRAMVPPHRHDIEAQATLVVSGHVGTWVEGETSVVGPGGYAFRPPGLAHCLFNPADEPARFVELTSPGERFQAYQLAINALAEAGNDDPDARGALAAEHGIEVVDADLSELRRRFGLAS